MVGGSQVLDQKGFFNIGKRNEMAARKLFHRNNVVIDFANTGGNGNRTLRLAINNGKCALKESGADERWI
jgi:chemotaxis protein CheD